MPDALYRRAKPKRLCAVPVSRTHRGRICAWCSKPPREALVVRALAELMTAARGVVDQVSRTLLQSRAPRRLRPPCGPSLTRIACSIRVRIIAWSIRHDEGWVPAFAGSDSHISKFVIPDAPRGAIGNQHGGRGADLAPLPPYWFPRVRFARLRMTTFFWAKPLFKTCFPLARKCGI